MPKVNRKKIGQPRSIPYARGFKPPSPLKISSALGLTLSTNEKKSIDYSSSLFSKIPRPISEDDWLAQYVEDGQTYLDFEKFNPWLSQRHRRGLKGQFFKEAKGLGERYPECSIILQPIGKFQEEDPAMSPSVEKLRKFTELYLGLRVVIAPAIELNQGENGDFYWNSPGDLKVKTKIESRSHKDRVQLNAVSVLKLLKLSIPNNALCVIGITMHDLFEAKPDLFVAGLAAGNFRVAVFSFYRYSPRLRFSTEFWHDVKFIKARSKTKKPEDENVLLLRCCRLLVHETAHLLGFDHCIYYNCCMNGSGHLSEDFRQPLFLCPVDLRKLKLLCNVDFKTRYEELLKFCTDNSFSEEINWLKRRLEEMNKAETKQESPETTRDKSQTPGPPTDLLLTPHPTAIVD